MPSEGTTVGVVAWSQPTAWGSGTKLSEVSQRANPAAGTFDAVNNPRLRGTSLLSSQWPHVAKVEQEIITHRDGKA